MDASLFICSPFWVRNYGSTVARLEILDFFFPLSKFSKLFNAFEIIFNILIPTSAVVPISAAAVDLYNVIVAYLRWYDDVAVMFLMFILSRKNLKFLEL